MLHIGSHYKEIKNCPDGRPRFILKKPEKAFSIAAPDWDARVKAVVKCLETTPAEADVEIGKKVKSIVKDLTENYANLQAHYQAAYLMFASNPCSKESEEECQKALKEIRDKTFILSKLEAKAKNLSRTAPKAKGIVSPVGGSAVSEPKKTWKVAGRPDKSGKPMTMKVRLYESKKGQKFRKTLMPGKGESKALLLKRMSDIEKLVSGLGK